MNTLLELLEQDCTQSPAQLAAQAGMTEAEARMNCAGGRGGRDPGIPGCDRLGPGQAGECHRPDRGEGDAQSLAGFDRIAERIYQYDEVESMYLMSGSFDLTVIISGRSLREVAQFVGERLAPLEGVTGTATHFILKKYKEKHLIFRPQEPQEGVYLCMNYETILNQKIQGIQPSGISEVF